MTECGRCDDGIPAEGGSAKTSRARGTPAMQKRQAIGRAGDTALPASLDEIVGATEHGAGPRREGATALEPVRTRCLAQPTARQAPGSSKRYFTFSSFRLFRRTGSLE